MHEASKAISREVDASMTTHFHSKCCRAMIIWDPVTGKDYCDACGKTLEEGDIKELKT